MQDGVLQQTIAQQHMCLSIKGALNNAKYKKNHTKSYADNDDGSPMTYGELKEFLTQSLAEGKRVLPMGDCDNFDYQTGCRGHGRWQLVADWLFETGQG
jgi:hypothetical protein